MDRFHPIKKRVCEIPQTGGQRLGVFEVMRPKPFTVLDYKISQFDTKIDTPEGTKIHYERTDAKYKLPPPGYIFPEQMPPPKPPKFIWCHGGPPCWTFWEDKRRKRIERKQEKARARLQEVMLQRKRVDFYLSTRGLFY